MISTAHRFLWPAVFSYLMISCVISSTFCTLSMAQQSDLYSKDKKSAQNHLFLLVHESLSPYLTHPQRRDSQEQIIKMERKIEIWRLESFERGDIDYKLCQAIRSLILGRLSSSRGIGYLFQEAPYINLVEIVFYRIKTEVNPNLDGLYQQTRRSKITARISIGRERASLLDHQGLKSTLRGPTCLTQARGFLDDLWIDDETTQRREKLRDAAIEMRARPSSTLQSLPLQKDHL